MALRQTALSGLGTSRRTLMGAANSPRLTRSMTENASSPVIEGSPVRRMKSMAPRL